MTASTTRSAHGSLLAATSLRRAACRLVLPTMTITVWSMLCCARSAELAANVRDAVTGVGMRAAHGIEFAAAGVYAGPVRGTLQYSPGQRVLCELRPARSLTGRVRLLACRRGAPLRCGLPRPSFGGDWFRHDSSERGSRPWSPRHVKQGYCQNELTRILLTSPSWLLLLN